MSQHGCPERLSNRSKGFQEDGSSQPTMEVLVETLTGTAFEMTVSPSDTIFAIKSKIYRVEGIPVSQQHLLYNLRELDDGLSLSEHAIADGARLRLVLGLRGGPVATRRLPPPEPWRDLERFLHLHKSDEDDSEWNGSSSGCKATVLVFREGERVNLVPVRENRDGTYSPLDHAKYSSSLSHPSEAETGEAGGGAAPGGGALSDNAVTLAKMMELRRRMDRLALHRRPPDRTGDTHDIQKTRSEETLSVPSLLDDSSEFASRSYAGYGDEEGFAPLYDGSYTRYDYDCGFADRYALLPPIGARADSEHSVQDAADERVKLSDALAGSILVKARDARDDDAILEEVLDGEPCLRRGDGSLAPIQATDYGAVSVGARWRRSSSSLGARAAPLADTLFCSSTSDLEQLRRNRILPALSRHRNREHLHLSDEGFDLTRPEPGPEPAAPRAELDKKARVRCAFCRKRLSIATEHTCRCGAAFCAPHRYAEVHGCAYDYKQRARALLRRDNPPVQAPKLPKI